MNVVLLFVCNFVLFSAAFEPDNKVVYKSQVLDLVDYISREELKVDNPYYCVRINAPKDYPKKNFRCYEPSTFKDPSAHKFIKRGKAYYDDLTKTIYPILFDTIPELTLKDDRN